jgi:hypothetical protein
MNEESKPKSKNTKIEIKTSKPGLREIKKNETGSDSVQVEKETGDLPPKNST